MKKYQGNRVLVYIPTNLDFNALLKSHPPKFKFNIEKFKYIVHLITAIPAFNKDILDRYNFVPINAKTLKKHVYDYPKYIDYLLRHGVLETNGHYVPGIKSKGFKFTPKYQTEIRVEKIPNIKTSKAMRKQKENIKSKRTYNYLYKWFNPMLQIDFNAATNYAKSELIKYSKVDLQKALRKFNANYANIYRIAESDFYFNIDNNIHRLHTNLTNLKSELRNFITYNGQKLVAVDFVNSQPMLSCVLLNEDFYKTTVDNPDFTFNYQNISKAVTNYFNNPSFSSSSSSFPSIMIPKIEESKTEQGFQTYFSECENGIIYEYIEKELKQKCNTEASTRKELKKIFFTSLFTDNRFIGQPEAKPKRIFRDLFPEVYKVFATIKKVDKKFLSLLLQSIESKLILDHITKRISEERPNMPMWTIHDSVVCPVGNEQYVVNIMQEETKKAIGVSPKVKYEYWTPDNLSRNNTSMG